MTMPTKPFRRRLVRAVLFTAIFVSAAGASAHVTVTPKESTPGAWEKYEIRLPNEKQAATTRLEVRFPGGLRVMSFEDKPGWTVEPLRDSVGAITGARWTGELPPERFVEFAIIAVNPKTPGELRWSASQTYADGQVVNWAGARGSATPAPTVMVRPATR